MHTQYNRTTPTQYVPTNGKQTRKPGIAGAIGVLPVWKLRKIVAEMVG